MCCVSGYYSRETNVIISKDKQYTAAIISNMLSNPMYSYKTNNKFLNLNSSRQENENFDSSLINSKNRHSYSNKELKIPENPLPFVRIKPKK